MINDPDVSHPSSAHLGTRLRELRATHFLRTNTTPQARPRELLALQPLPVARALLLALTLVLVGGWALSLPIYATPQPLTSLATRVAPLTGGISSPLNSATPHFAAGVVPRVGASPASLSWRDQAPLSAALAWYAAFALTIVLLWLALASVYGASARRIGRVRGSPYRQHFDLSQQSGFSRLSLCWLPMGRWRASAARATDTNTSTDHNGLLAKIPARMRGTHASAVAIDHSGTGFGPWRRRRDARVEACVKAMRMGM